MGEPKDLGLTFEPVEENDELEEPAEFLDEDPEVEATCEALDLVLDQKRLSETVSSEEDLRKRFDTLVAGQFTPDNIAVLAGYVSENPDEHLPLLENLAAEAMENGRGLGLSAFFILSNQGDRGGRNMDERLVKQLALRYSDDPRLLDQIKYLAWANHQEGNSLTHFILDFVTDYEESYQNINWNKQFIPSCQDNFYHYFADRVADGVIPSCNNYLVESHFRDMADSGNQDTPREGKLAGMPGGGTDCSVFTFDHIAESYENRLALGINQGLPIANPVLRITPNLFGYYENGRLGKVFSGQDYKAEDVVRREAGYVAANNSADPRIETIYEEINRPVAQLDPRFTHQSTKLGTLRPIWALAEHLKSTGQDFFFDLHQVNTAELHPLVVGDMMTRNIQLVQKTEGAANRARELSKEEFDKLLFPSGEEQRFALETYNYLSSLGMRKKLERDFGVDLSSYSLFVQRNLLAFMAHLETLDTKRFKKFLEVAGDDAIKSFVAMDYGMKDNYLNGEFVLDLADRLGPACKPLFEKYSAIVDVVSNIEEVLQREFTHSFTAQAIHSVVTGLLARGRDILLDSYRSSDSPEEIIAKLADYNAANIAILEVTRRAKQNGEPINLEAILSYSEKNVPGPELGVRDQEAMLRITEKNYSIAPNPAAPEAQLLKQAATRLESIALEGVRSGFANPNCEFVIARLGEDIISFLRLEPYKDGVYFGSFNVDESARGASLGGQIAQKVLAERAKQSRIYAVTSVMTDITSHYIGRLGFVADSIIQDAENTGEALFAIERDDRLNGQYSSRKISPENIVKLEQEGATQPDLEIVKFDHIDPREYQTFLAKCEEMFASGRVLTAYFRFPPESMVKYAVFETKKSLDPEQKSKVA